MTVAWILSIIVCMKGQRRFLPLCIVLTVQMAEELIVAWLHASGQEFVWIYHIYVVIDYTMFCIYFMPSISLKYQKWVILSIVIFAVASVCISYWYYRFENYPGVNINTEGVLICIICTYVLLNLDIQLFDAIYKHPNFWFSLGLLIFFGGTFFSNGLYTYLYELDPVQAKKLFNIINSQLNLIQYTCFIIGFVCAIPRKSTIGLS